MESIPAPGQLRLRPVNRLPRPGWHGGPMERRWHGFRRMARDERGSVPVEYAMIAVFISIIAITALTTIGTRTEIHFDGIIPGLTKKTD
jgi:Flp pilus assembly pilin Flp